MFLGQRTLACSVTALQSESPVLEGQGVRRVFLLSRFGWQATRLKEAKGGSRTAANPAGGAARGAWGDRFIGPNWSIFLFLHLSMGCSWVAESRAVATVSHPLSNPSFPTAKTEADVRLQRQVRDGHAGNSRDQGARPVKILPSSLKTVSSDQHCELNVSAHRKPGFFRDRLLPVKIEIPGGDKRVRDPLQYYPTAPRAQYYPLPPRPRLEREGSS